MSKKGGLFMSVYKLLEIKLKYFIENTIDLNKNDVEKA